MKNLLLILLLAVVPMAHTGCGTAPTERVATVKTLKAIGETVATAMESAARLRVQGVISEKQWQDIAAIHDNRFLPAYRLAVTAVSADLSSAASPDVLAVAGELINLVATYQK